MDAETSGKFGLVLGGGGARGLAHIGVLKVLERAGLTPAYISGTSMGGLIGTLYAAGWSPDRLETEALRITRLPEMVKLVDLSKARRGLIEGHRVREYLFSLLGPVTFAELDVPLALTAVDLCTGQEVLMQDGPVLEALAATIAVPSLFPAVSQGGCRLVDGGILNNIPVAAVRSLGAKTVAAVDVTPELPGDEDYTGDGIPAIFPGVAKDFYLAELVMISTLTRLRLQENPPDMVLRPVLPPSISIFWGFSRVAEAIAAGETAAEQALAGLENLVRG